MPSKKEPEKTVDESMDDQFVPDEELDSQGRRYPNLSPSPQIRKPQELIVKEDTISLTGVMSPEQMRQAVGQERERMTILMDFVSNGLEDGKDYGTIKIGGKETKPTLFKSGMEKVFNMLGIRSELVKDTETLEMLPINRYAFCYLCKLYKGSQLIGEGRGACSVDEKANNINNAIKIAEKRARMDACLNLGFSFKFTQDLEDMDMDTTPIRSTANESGTTPPKQKSSTTTTDYPGWVAGDVRRGVFAVKQKEMQKANSGTVYAILSGVFRTSSEEPWEELLWVRAWKNTHHLLHEGGAYRVMIEASEFKGKVTLAFTTFESTVREPLPKVSPIKEPVNARELLESNFLLSEEERQQELDSLEDAQIDQAV